MTRAAKSVGYEGQISRINILDVGAFLQSRQSDTVQNNINAFDFTGDGVVNILNVGKLLQQVL